MAHTTPILVLLLSSLAPRRISAQAPDPNQITISELQAYKDQDVCAQNCLAGPPAAFNVADFLQCGTNACLCRDDRQFTGLQFLSSCAVSTCSNANDATSIMSIFTAYCAGLGSTAIRTPPSTFGSDPGPTASAPPGGGAAGADATPTQREVTTVFSVSTLTPTVKDVITTITTTNAAGLAITTAVVTALPVLTETETRKGLSQSDRIALGVGLGVGIPTFIVTLWACLKGD